MDAFTLVAKLTLDSSAYDQGLNQAKTKGSMLGSAVAGGLKIAGAAVIAATGAAVSFGKSAVTAGMEFDASMAQVAATMGKTTDEIGDLRDFAQEMGRTTKFSATESADALNYMALAGYDAETAMKMLPTVLNLAAAGNFDLAQASDMVTDAQSALGLSLDQTAEMVDQMAKTASKSNTSVDQLGEAFLTVGGTAKNLKGGTVELSTALGILADNGMKGAEGGTKLRNMITSLTAPTDKAGKLMKELGVSAFDADGNMRPLNDTFSDLGHALENLTQEQRMQALSEIFNARDIKAAEAMLANYSDRWDELSENIDNAQGAAQKMAATQLDNLAGDVTLFKSALEGAKIAISDGLTPTLREFVQMGAEGLSKVTEGLKEGGLSGALEAVGEFLSKALNAIIESAPKWVDAGMKLLGALGQGLMDNLDSIVDAAVKILEIFLEGIFQGLPAIAEGAVQIIGKLAEGLGEALPELIPAAVDAIMMIVEALIDNAGMLIDGAIALITGLTEGLINSLPIIVERVPEIITSLLDAIITNAPKLAMAGPELIVALINGLLQALPSLITMGPRLVISLVEGIIQGIPHIFEVGKNIIQGLIEGILSFIPNLIEGIKKAVDSLINAFKSLLGIHSPSTVMMEMGNNLMQGLIDGILAMLSAAVEAITNVCNAIFETVKGIWENIKSTTEEIWNNIKDTMAGLIEEAKERVSEVVQNILDNVREKWENLKNNTQEMWENIKSAVHDTIEALKRSVEEKVAIIRDRVTDVVNFIKELPGKALDWGKDLIGNFISGIQDKWSSFKDTISGIAETVRDFLGFSEPKEGPLSNFHTYAPDMMKLFAQGLRDNEKLITDQLKRSFDFTDVIDVPEVKAEDAGLARGNSIAYGGVTINVYGTEGQNEHQIADIVMDRILHLKQADRAVYE